MIKDLYIGEKITMSTLKKDISQTSDNKPESVDALALKKNRAIALKLPYQQMLTVQLIK